MRVVALFLSGEHKRQGAENHLDKSSATRNRFHVQAGASAQHRC